MSKLPRFSASFAIGVGNNPYPVPLVRGADGARRYAIPFRVKPALGQVPENNSHPVTKQRCHVLHDAVARSYQAKGSHKFPVESRTLTGKTGALSGDRNILTWEAAADDIYGPHAGERLRVHGTNVVQHGDARPVLGEDTAAEWIDLAEGDGSHPSSFETEAEAADS